MSRPRSKLPVILPAIAGTFTGKTGQNSKNSGNSSGYSRNFYRNFLSGMDCNPKDYLSKINNSFKYPLHLADRDAVVGHGDALVFGLPVSAVDLGLAEHAGAAVDNKIVGGQFFGEFQM